MWKALEPRLIARAGLLKQVPVRENMHRDTLRVAMDITGYWQRAAIGTEHWRDILLPHVLDVENNSPDAVSALCIRVINKKAQVSDIYARRDYIIRNLQQFTVEQVLLLLYTLETQVRIYGMWFRVNCDDLSMLLMSCHRFLLQEMATMTPEQLSSALLIFGSLSRRYQIFGLSHLPLQRQVTKRLLKLLSDAPASWGSGAVPKRCKESESEIQKLPTKVQSAYRQVYPFFEAIHGRLRTTRGTISSLVCSAIVIQQQYQADSPFPLESFNAICKMLKRLVTEIDMFSLETLLKLVTLLHRNSSISPEAAKLDKAEIRALAIKQENLTIDTFLFLPSERENSYIPPEVEQCVTRLLASTLESPSMESLASCLVAIKEAKFINEHIILLFMPYVANRLRDNGLDAKETLDFISVASSIGLTGFPFWTVYFSVLETSSGISGKKDIDTLISLCDGIVACVRSICDGVTGERCHTTDSVNTGNQEGISKKDNQKTTITDTRWLGYIYDTILINVSDINSAGDTTSLGSLMARRFDIDFRSDCSIHRLVEALRALEAAAGLSIKSLEGSLEKTGPAIDDRQATSFSNSKNGEVSTDSEAAVDIKLVALSRSYRSAGLHIGMLERLFMDLL